MSCTLVSPAVLAGLVFLWCLRCDLVVWHGLYCGLLLDGRFCPPAAGDAGPADGVARTEPVLLGFPLLRFLVAPLTALPAFALSSPPPGLATFPLDAGVLLGLTLCDGDGEGEVLRLGLVAGVVD